MANKIVIRNDTTANWATHNPTLLVGEMGIDTDKNLYKIGDGITAWLSLAFSPTIPAGVTGSTGATGPSGTSGSGTGATGVTGATGSTGTTATPIFSFDQLSSIDGRANKYRLGAAGDANTGDAFRSGINLPDGRVFCVPNNYRGGSKYIYNPATNAFENGTGTLNHTDYTAPTNAIACGILMPNNKILLVPKNYTGTQYLYDIATSTLGPGPAVHPNGFGGAVLLPNGKVFCVSDTYSGSQNIYNPTTNEWEYVATATSRGALGAVLLPNGKVLLIGNDSPYCLFNPATLGYETSVNNSGSSLWNGVLLPNGKVFCPPYRTYAQHTRCIYNYVSNAWEDGPAATVDYTYNSGILMPNGLVFCIGRFYSGTKNLYDYVSNTYVDGPGGLGDGNTNGAAILPSGQVFLVPNKPAITNNIYAPKVGTQSAMPWVNHPCFSKGV